MGTPVTSISRLIRAYALLVKPPAPFVYFQYFTEWDNYAHLLLIAFCTWLGDILVVSPTPSSCPLFF